MKIVIVSDTHGDIYALQKVLLRENNVDLYLHAGDVSAPKETVNPFAAVRGNCDGYFRQDYELSYECDTPYGKLHMEHIPLSDIRMEALKLDGVKIFVNGHTHVRKQKIENGVYIFCPGSLSFPRDNSRGTYLVLNITEEAVNASFKEI